MNTELYEKIVDIAGKESVITNEPMRKHTTFKIGGNADFFVTPNNKKEAAEIVRLLLSYNEPFEIVGNGSNLLVSDKGIRGWVVCISAKMGDISVNGNEIACEAGALLSKVASVALENSLEGLVFASGIPGSIGGAVVMNAGAYGGQMEDVVKSVELLDLESGETVVVKGSKMQFGYRTSIVKHHPYLVLSATLSLHEGNHDELKAATNELAGKRRDKQPLEYPSAGSTFKRPEGYFAGKLIEDSGLKGYTVGGAMVSDKHCGFVINKNNATADDVLTLIRNVRAKVHSCYNVELEPEVCMLGEGIEL